MKLRFRANSLRLRVNRKEVEALAAGHVLKEQIAFPGGTALTYVLKPESSAEPQAFFENGSIQIAVPRPLIANWASIEDIGIYFTLITGAEPLKIALEKDLACIDGPLEEIDPHAFPRTTVECGNPHASER